jgi:hypothetical protein
MRASQPHPTLARACADIAALGLRVSAKPLPGAARYLVVGGRSNARWWLIPLVTTSSAASGFALFQPQLASARVMKGLAVIATICGRKLLARRSAAWSMVGQSTLARHFPESQHPVFAYFTGTDGPHRKITVQVMDEDGTILGYAKSSSDPVVSRLIAREAQALEELQRVGLLSALVPSLRFSGDVDGTYILVTDSRKTVWSSSDRTYGAVHRAFLQELIHKTRQPDISLAQFTAAMRESWGPLRDRVEHAWQDRIDRGLQAMGRRGEARVPACLGHGDFTPWNTYGVNGRLYVFDWEYADAHACAGSDAIHFIHSQPRLWRSKARARIVASRAELLHLFPQAGAASIWAMHLVYAITQALRVIEKMAVRSGSIAAWDGCSSQASLIDELLADRET